MNKSTNGFTLIELMVTVVVITILASVGTVTYSALRNRGHDTAVQADMLHIAKKMQETKIANYATSAYPIGNTALETAVNLKVNKRAYMTSPAATYNLLFCYPTSTSPTQYVLLAQSKSGKRYSMTNSEKITEYTGGVAWTTTAAMCDSVATGWTANGAGYSSADTTTGPWRTWAGGN